MPLPLGDQIHEFVPGDQVWVKDCKHGSMAPHWKGPYTVVLTTPLAVKVAGVTPWINHMSMKRQTQKTLSGLCRGTPLTLERLRSSLRRRKRRSWTSAFRMKPHNQLLLLGLINVILNLTSVQLRTMFSSHGNIPTWTSTTPSTAGYVGLCLCL